MAGSGNNLSHLASGRWAKVFILEKVVPPDRVTLPAEARQLAHPSCLDPPSPPQKSLNAFYNKLFTQSNYKHGWKETFLIST